MTFKIYAELSPKFLEWNGFYQCQGSFTFQLVYNVTHSMKILVHLSSYNKASSMGNLAVTILQFLKRYMATEILLLFEISMEQSYLIELNKTFHGVYENSPKVWYF